MIAIPVVAVLVGAKTAVVGMTVLGTLLTTQLLLRGRAHVRWRAAALATVAAFAGMPLGLLAITRVDERTLTGVIAVMVLVFTALLWRRLTLPRSRATEAVAGFFSGVLATSTGTSGPPLVIAFHSMGLEPAAFRATLSAVFLVQGLAALTGFAATGNVTTDVGRVILAGIPGLAIGSVVGERGFARIDRVRFRRVVLAMLFASGTVSLAKVVLG